MTIEITRPLMTLTDAAGIPIPGVSQSRDIVEMAEKASKLVAGTYKVVRPDATIVVAWDVAPDPDPTPDPTPDPDPIPDPDPTPDPIPGDKPAVFSRSLNYSKLITFPQHNDAQRYQRWQELIILTGETATVKFLGMSLGGARRTLDNPDYKLSLNGKVVATSPGGAQTGQFAFPLADVAEGWYVMDIAGAADETCTALPVYVLKGATAQPQEWTPVYSSSYDQREGAPIAHTIDWAPTSGSPTPVALNPGQCTPFSNVATTASLWHEELVPFSSADSRRFAISKEGVVTTANLQRYTWWDFLAKYPKYALLDGPRGVGNMGAATHVSIGAGKLEDAPGSPVTGNVYALDSWRMCRISPTGTITTLVGYRHAGTPNYWKDPSTAELVGDWSAIPEERHGFHELWGMCWKPDTLLVDHTADPIPAEQNRVPHVTAPVVFLADSQNNRICRVEFNATAHGIPPKVTEFLTGLADPWDCVEWQGKLIVSERKAHRIVQYNMDSGDLERIIVYGANLSTIDSSRFVQRNASINIIRAEDCVGPEGLYVMDDWLYFGSMAMAQVKRVNLVTGAIEVVRNGQESGNYYKIAVSDGTFGPKGTVFTTHWTNFLPFSYLPDGSWWHLLETSPSSGMYRGSGFPAINPDYGSAIAVMGGRLICGGSTDGLLQFRKILPNDPAISVSQWMRGKAAYSASGYGMTRGHGGYGFYGLPLPWGENVDMDYFFESNGIQRG